MINFGSLVRESLYIKLSRQLKILIAGFSEPHTAGQFFVLSPVFFGIGLATYFAVPFEPPMALLLVLLCIGLAFFTVVRGYFSLVVVFVLAGSLWAPLRANFIAIPPIAETIDYAPLTGTVVTIDRVDDQRYRALLRDVTMKARGEMIALEGRVRLTVRTQGAFIRPGDRIETAARMQPPPGPVEPGGYDPALFAWFEGITAYGVAMAPVKRVETKARAGTGLWIEGLRDSIAARLRSGLEGPNAGLAIAVVTGLRGGLDPAVTQAMRDSGLAHLLAISGLHMGLACATLFFFVRAGLALLPGLALHMPIKKLAALVALAGGVFYLLIAGSPLPTQRALVMVGLSFGAILLDRRAISLRLLAFAAWIILLINPVALISAGFQMSFAAVLVLVSFYEWWSGREARQRARQPAGVGAPGLTQRIARYFLGVIITTILAEISIGPLALYHFNRVTAFGLLANLVAVPLMAFWVMPLMLLALALMPLGLEGWVLWLLDIGIGAIIAVAQQVAALPGAVFLVHKPPGMALVSFSCALIMLCLYRAPGLKGLGLVLALVAVMSWRGADRPLFWIDEATEQVALRGASGLYVRSPRRARYEVGRWAEGVGLDQTEPLPDRPTALADGWWASCDDLGCQLWQGPQPRQTVVISFADQALIDACRSPSALIIALQPPPRTCGKTVYAGGGMRALPAAPARADTDLLQLEFTADGRQNRPWSQPR